MAFVTVSSATISCSFTPASPESIFTTVADPAAAEIAIRRGARTGAAFIAPPRKESCSSCFPSSSLASSAGNTGSSFSTAIASTPFAEIDFLGAFQGRLNRAKPLHNLHRTFVADPRSSGYVVARVTSQCHHINPALRRHAQNLLHLCRITDQVIFRWIQDVYFIVHQLHH